MSESEKTPVLSPENVPTVVVVTFVLALFATSFAVINWKRTSTVAVGVAALEVRDTRGDNADNDAAAKQIAALEARVAALEAQGAAAAEPAAEPAAE